MIMGHYAAALVPHSLLKRTAPFWLLLLCSQVQDVISITLALMGVEVLTPGNLLDLSFKALNLKIVYSHVIVMELIYAVVVGVVVGLIWRRRDLALWAGALVLIHEACDQLSGWAHPLMVGGPPALGLDLYAQNQVLAFLLEYLFMAAILIWYVRREQIVGRNRWLLFGAYFGGTLLYVPLATMSIRQVFEALR